MGVKVFWAQLRGAARVGFVVGAVLIVAATAVLGWWALRTDYQVLFADLSAQDAAAMTHELDQMKLPYRLGEDGTTILVEGSAVHPTRLKLMGKDLPLHGAVGFELFNNADFGMTEFAQKVNYQRALQGELVRTIVSLSEVASARVHLAFPEEGLFKREQAHAKASISLSLRNGRSLRREQVRGIQRLVAAAVPGIDPRDVTIVNDQGVALTQDGEEGVASATSQRLDLKRETEQYLAQKANAVLDKAFGPGQAMASVDVTLDMNQVKVTTEDVTTPPSPPGEIPTGVVVRERETTRESGRVGGPGPDDAAEPVSTQREVDYQLGRRVEQVASSPGAISRLQVMAVVRAPLDPVQVEQLRQLLGSSVGALRERGDSIVVQPLSGLAAAAGAGEAPHEAAATVSVTPAPAPSAARAAASAVPEVGPWAPSALVLASMGALGLVWRRRRSSRAAGTSDEGPSREARLAQVRAWLNEGEKPQQGTRVR